MADDYHKAMHAAQDAYQSIAAELPEEAQYIVPMAYRIRWYFHINLRALQWLTELRLQAAGHPNYRHVAPEMARQVIKSAPLLSKYFKFVDFDGHDLGCLSQEERSNKKRLANNKI